MVGWAEGRAERTERSKVAIDDYALSSWAQTRGRSRCLAAPLRFIVKLAGYATTPAEEMVDTDALEAQVADLQGSLHAAQRTIDELHANGPVATLDLAAQEEMWKALWRGLADVRRHEVHHRARAPVPRGHP